MCKTMDLIVVLGLCIIHIMNGISATSQCQNGPSFHPWPTWPSQRNYGLMDPIIISCMTSNTTGEFKVEWKKDNVILNSDRYPFSIGRLRPIPAAPE